MPAGLTIASMHFSDESRARLSLVPAELADRFDPATHCLYEWAEYWLECPEADCLLVGGERVEPKVPGCFCLRFENHLGLSAIQPFAQGRPLSEAWNVEVLSPKFSSSETHLDFLSRLLDDLFARAARLPFTLSGPTARGVVESLRPPTPLFVLHFLLQHGRELAAALATVQGSPHRRLEDRPDCVPIAEASEVDADVLLRILEDTDRWVPATGFPLAERLAGRAPTHVWQRLPEETYDTRENRFVRAFLRQVLVAGDALSAQRWWANVPFGRQRRVHEVTSQVRQALLRAPLSGVGEMERLPASSQVLLRREGYRDLLRLWQLFQQARRPLFERLRQAMELRDIATLYEVWVFFALVEKISDVTGECPVIDLEVSDDTGLEHDAKATFGAQGALLYNRSFSRSRGRWRSYSVPLRPDFTWEVNGRPEVVLDAKFRLERLDGDADDDDSPSTTAKRADLYKMHAYRDALGVRAAVAVYPGDVGAFYDCNARRQRNTTLAEVLHDGLQGIGAIPLRPAQPTEEA